MTLEIEHQRSKGSLAVLALLTNLKELMESASKQAAKKAAERFLEGLKQNWAGQRAFLWPLTQAYREHKQQEGLDDRILIATGELLSSLQITEVKGSFVVGPPPNVKHRSGIDLGTLLKIIEYGSPSRNLPSRAILRQTAGALRDELTTIFKEEFVRALKAEVGF